MSTTVIETIGAGAGRDYPSISAWNEATKILDLVTLDEIRIGVCYDDDDFSEAAPLVFVGATVDATHYRKLTVAEGHRHLGSRSQGVNLTFTGANTSFSFITITEKYFQFEWLRIHRETAPADNYNANIIYCPGSNASKFITLNKILIHDWEVNGDYGDLFGISITQNGGCRVLDTVVVNLFKDNDYNDEGSSSGIYVSASSAPDDNYLINCVVLNITCAANFMKATGGIAVYDANTHVWNCIGIVRHYVYDQSSIPNVTVEDYSFDFSDYAAADSGYNCERGGGYEQLNFLPGTDQDPLHSLTKQDPFAIFVFPGPDPDYGNGFYGYGFHAKGVGAYGKHTDRYIYQAALGESGKITFSDMYVLDMVAGYLYVDGSTVGALTELDVNGDPFEDDAPRTLAGVFSYDRTAGTFTQDSGDAELATALEMVDGLIQFKESYIPTDWTNNPVLPSGGSYTQDATYPTLIGADATHGAGLVTGPAVLLIGSRHNDSFRYHITDRVLTTEMDLRLKEGSPCAGAGLAISLETFPELAHDITEAERTEPWNMGAYPVLTTPTPSSVTVANSLAMLNGVAAIQSKFQLRSKQLNVLMSLYLDATAHDTAGKSDTFLRAMFVSGSASIAFKINFDVVTGSGQTANVPSLHIEYNNIDGSTDYTLIDLEAPVFNVLEKTYYRFDLETIRNGKALDFFLTIHKWGKNTDDVAGSERWLSIQDRIYVYSVKVTFDYFFSLRIESGSTNSALGLGVDSVRAISKDNIVKYTPITYET